jgi:Primase C terminal 2 (PriCT-2)
LRTLESGASSPPALSERLDTAEFPLLVDLDIEGGASEHPIPERHVVDPAFLRAAVEAFRTAYAGMCTPEPARKLARDRTADVIVMQRPAPYGCNSRWKGGVHLMFPDVRVTRHEHAVVRERVLAEGHFARALADLPACVTSRDTKRVVDSCFSSRKASWQTYGSSKPGTAPYLATWLVRGDEWRAVPLPASAPDLAPEPALEPTPNPAPEPIPRADDWRYWVAWTRVGTLPVPMDFVPPPDLTEAALDEVEAFRVRADRAPNPVLALQNLGAGSEEHDHASDRARFIARACLPKLAERRANVRDDWWKVGGALRASSSRTDLMWDDWLAFSRRCPGKFSEEACAARWHEAGEFLAAGGASPITVGTRVAWAKEDIATVSGDETMQTWWTSVQHDADMQGLMPLSSCHRRNPATTTPTTTTTPPPPPEIVVADDLEAAQTLLGSDSLRGRAWRCGVTVWVRMDNGNWTNSSEAVTRTLTSLCQHSGIVRQDARGTTHKDASMLPHARNIVKTVLNEAPEDENFDEHLRTRSTGKVFFTDGVYDFGADVEGHVTGDIPCEFRADENFETDMTTVRVPRPFPRDEARNRALEDEVWQRVFLSIFRNEEDARCFLQHVARAIAGMYEDKQWIACQAERNSGKGVLEQLLRSAFGSRYVVTMNPEVLLMGSGGNGCDEAKRLSWLLQIAHGRLVFAKEMPVDASAGRARKVDGSAIKGKLSSGGDTVLVRSNYADEIDVVCEARLFLMVNDLPKITPADVMELMHMFPLPFQFVGADVLGP